MSKYWLTLLGLIIAASGYCGQTKRVIIDSLQELAAGKTESVSLSAEGQLSVGPDVKELAEFEASHLWVGAERNRDEFVIGSGEEGMVYLLSNTGEVREFIKFDETDIYALAVDSNKDVYVATSPNGKIFKVRPNGKSEVFFETGEEYVWDMLWSKGALYLATGPEGKIFKVTAKGKGEIYYDADEPHVRCLAFGAKGELLAGTVGKGLVYHIYEKGKAVALFDSGKTEIRDVAVNEKGDIYFVAIGDGKGDAPISKVPKSSKTSVIDIKGVETVSSSEVKTQENSKTTVTSAKKEVTKSIKGGSIFYVMRSDDKAPHVLWKTSLLIHSMSLVKDGLVLNAGDQGYLYHADQNNVMSRWGSLESGQATVMLPMSQGELMVLTSNLAKAYLVDVTGNKEGVYRTNVVDTKLFAQWGAVRAFGEGSWKLRTRSGNTSDPDKSWYDWEALKSDKVVSPSARYLQVELRINSGYVDRLELYYQVSNIAPEVKSVKVLEPNLGYTAIETRAPQLQPKTAQQLVKGSSNLTLNKSDRYYPVEEPGLRTIVWEAEDANQDELTYQLEIKKENERDWQSLKEELDQPMYSWDTSGWPDGVYKARVIASDLPDNPQDYAKQAERESSAWEIDHTKPEITIFNQGADYLEFKVEDETSLLEAVSVSGDGADYEVVIPRDGVLDSKSESFRVSTKDKDMIYIRARDMSGNVAGLRR